MSAPEQPMLDENDASAFQMDWQSLWKHDTKPRDWLATVKHQNPTIVMGYLFEQINKYGEPSRMVVSYIKYAMAVHYMPISDYFNLFLQHFGTNEDWLFQNKTVFEQLFVDIAKVSLQHVRVKPYLSNIPREYPTYHNMIKIKDVIQRKRKRREIPVEQHFCHEHMFKEIQKTIIVVLNKISKYAHYCIENDQPYQQPIHTLTLLMKNLNIRVLLLYADVDQEQMSELTEYMAIIKQLFDKPQVQPNLMLLRKHFADYGMFINYMLMQEKYKVEETNKDDNTIRPILSMMIDETISSMEFGAQAPGVFATRLSHFAQYHKMPIYRVFIVVYELVLEKVLQETQNDHIGLLCYSFLVNTLPLMLDQFSINFTFTDMFSSQHTDVYAILQHHITKKLIECQANNQLKNIIFSSIATRSNDKRVSQLFAPYFTQATQEVGRVFELVKIDSAKLKNFHVQWLWVSRMDQFMKEQTDQDIIKLLPMMRRNPPLLDLLHAQAKVLPLLQTLVRWLFQRGVQPKVNIEAFKNVFITIYFIIERHEIFEDDNNKEALMVYLKEMLPASPTEEMIILATYYFSLLKNYGRVKWTSPLPATSQHIVHLIPYILMRVDSLVDNVLAKRKPVNLFVDEFKHLFKEQGQFATILFWQGLYATGQEGIAYHVQQDLELFALSKKMLQMDIEVSVPMIQRLIEPVRCAKNLDNVEEKIKLTMMDILKQHHEMVPNFIVVHQVGKPEEIKEMIVRFESGLELFREANNIFKHKYNLGGDQPVATHYNVTPFEMFALASKKMALHQFCDLIMHEAQVAFDMLGEYYANIFMRCVGYNGLKLLLERFDMNPVHNHLRFIFACLVHHRLSDAQKVDLASFFYSLLQRHAVRYVKDAQCNVIHSFIEASGHISWILRDILTHVQHEKFFSLMVSLYHTIPMYLKYNFVQLFNIRVPDGTNQLLSLVVREIQPSLLAA